MVACIALIVARGYGYGYGQDSDGDGSRLGGSGEAVGGAGTQTAAAPMDPAVVPADPIARGAYLARAGHCAGCHTARGGAAYAGGRGIDTPFGTVYASNLTPDAATGLGGWTAADFWRALHHGRSKDGRLLYPAFPYPSFTLVTRDDSDALFAFLRSLPAVEQANRAHALRFPYDSQLALAVWRGLFFSPGTFEPDAARPPDWNRGAYLVRGLGHCGACHAARNLLGATRDAQALGGGLIAAQDWYAPSLSAADEAGVADWTVAQVAELLRTGATARAVVVGPMAEVVLGSTQHLAEPDLRAIAAYLRALPPSPPRSDRDAPAADPAAFERGAAIYDKHCADCHGQAGQGAAGIYPALAGNRAVTMQPPVNVIRTVLAGGFAPATAANPRPYGMPPFFQQLDDAEVAAVVTFIRAAWGNRAAPVAAREVDRLRRGRTE